TDVAFKSGHESLSGFADSFKHIFGVSTKHSKQQTIIDLKRIETPLGTMYAYAVTQGICLLEFIDRKLMASEFNNLAKTLNATVVQGDNTHFPLLEKELREYFEGKRQEFTVPLYSLGTEFQNRVWEALKNIPYGETKTYKQQAIAIGSADSVRAVAN